MVEKGVNQIRQSFLFPLFEVKSAADTGQEHLLFKPKFAANRFCKTDGFAAIPQQKGASPGFLPMPEVIGILKVSEETFLSVILKMQSAFQEFKNLFRLCLERRRNGYFIHRMIILYLGVTD
ncbi:MAG: hypothetical protein IJG60_05500 [Thermoguttaceae bacterium]|nr:hypothetical protein [Thermoguttaceae bacterium]